MGGTSPSATVKERRRRRRRVLRRRQGTVVVSARISRRTSAVTSVHPVTGARAARPTASLSRCCGGLSRRNEAWP